MIEQLGTAGALPALELAMKFAGQRNTVLAHNIANLDTPGFRGRDVSPRAFQELLGEAIDERRGRNGGAHGRLMWAETREIGRAPGGGLSLTPRTPSSNILFHDQNNRDLERTMQALVENAAMYRMSADFLRSRLGLLRDAIAERV